MLVLDRDRIVESECGGNHACDMIAARVRIDVDDLKLVPQPAYDVVDQQGIPVFGREQLDERHNLLRRIT